MQHYVCVAWNVQIFGLCVPRFLQQVDILVLFIPSNNLKTIFLTPQEVGDWFGCKEKKKGNLFLSFWLILFFWKKKKGSCFLKGKEFDCFCFLKKKKRKFIFKILADSVF